VRAERAADPAFRCARSNGFSGGVDTEAFNGPDPLWRDVLRKHEQKPIVRPRSPSSDPFAPLVALPQD